MIETSSRSIIFSAAMVRALLDEKKTQTRRLVTGKHLLKFGLEEREYKGLNVSPYGMVGGRLWVKETWAAPKAFDGVKPRDLPENLKIEYRANDLQYPNPDLGKWRTPLFMSEAVSRINLVIDSIRIERLDECTVMDAQAEGVGYESYPDEEDYIGLYRSSWETIHGKNSWEINPLVWVLSFTRLSK